MFIIRKWQRVMAPSPYIRLCQKKSEMLSAAHHHHHRRRRRRRRRHHHHHHCNRMFD